MGTTGMAKTIVVGIWVAIWLMLAANYMTPSVASGLVDHKAQIEQMLEAN